MTGKKTGTAAALMAGVLLLGGCSMLGGSTWEPKAETAVSIKKDGSITEQVQESFDASYYNADELQNMITSSVSQYNTEHGENSVTVGEFRAEDQTADLTMQYASAEDYAQFNNTEFYYGSMINAQLEGYLFDVSYKKIQNGVVTETSVSGSEVIKEMDKQVLVVRAPMEIQVPGNVLYTSSNAEVLSGNVVNATGEQEDESEGLVLPSNSVYKKDKNTYAEQTAANRVYIIFDMD